MRMGICYEKKKEEDKLQFGIPEQTHVKISA